MPNQGDFVYAGDPKTQDQQTAVPKVKKTTYPSDGQPTWNNPGQIMYQLAQDPHVRKFYQTMMGQHQLSDKDMWEKGNHILDSTASGSMITQVILQQDKTFLAEATRNNKPLQMLHRARQELNTSDFKQFYDQASNSTIQTFQKLLSGGGQGLGMIQNLLSSFNQMGQQATSTGVQQNAALANNQFLTANGELIANTMITT